MSESKFEEPTRGGRIVDFCVFTLPWFIFGAIGFYKEDPYAWCLFGMGWISMIMDVVLENRSTIAQARKEIAELKEIINNK